MRWMNLEPIVQSEVRWKEKDKYQILIHIYGIQKDGTDEIICRAATETQTQGTDLWMWSEEGEEGEGETMERETWKCTFTIRNVKQPTGICYTTQRTQTGALKQPREVGWGGR